MSNKPIVYHLEVLIQKEPYIVASLSFNKRKGELSYHFHHSSDSPQKHFFCDSEEYANRKDHITFHEKKVHTTDNEEPSDGITYENGPLLIDPPILTPLFIESIYLQKDASILRKKNQLKNKEGLFVKILESNEVQNFSVVALLVPSIMGSATALFGLQFLDTPEGFIRPPLLADLWDVRNPLVPIRGIWDQWEILIFVTSYTRTILSPIPAAIGSSFRLPDYQNFPAALTDLLLQTKPLQYKEALLELFNDRLRPRH